MKRAVLAPMAEQPISGFTHQFQLPADCIRVLPEDTLRSINYSVEGRKILCDVATLFLRYVWDEQDEQQFDEGLAETIAHYLAYDLAYSLQQTAELRDTMFANFDRFLKQAAMWDSQSGGTLEVVSADFLLQSRVGGVDATVQQHDNFGGGTVPPEPAAPEALPESPSVPDMSAEQRGMEIVPQNSGTLQIVFPTPFTGVPAWVDCTLALGSPTDPTIESHPDQSTLTATGFTAVFAAQTPTSNYRLYWTAILTV